MKRDNEEAEEFFRKITDKKSDDLWALRRYLV